MKRTKLVSLLLCLAMICSLVLVACGGSEEPATQGGNNGGIVRDTDETDPNSVWDYEVKDLKGHEFLFLVRDNTHTHLNTNEVYAEALNGDKINDAVFKRNSTLATKFNCSVMEERTDNVTNTVREPLIAGEYVYDYIYAGLQIIRSLSTASLLVDLNTVKNLDLDKNWWDQNLRNGLNIRGHLFCATGDAGTLDDRGTWIMFFNRDLMEINECENPYDLVSAGTWTVQKAYELGEKCWSDEDGDGVFYPNGKDIAAYLGESANNYFHVAACGGRISEVSSAGDITIGAQPSKDLLAIWAELKPFLTNPHRDVSDSGSRFRAGKAAFYAINCGALLNFADTTVNFGVIPLPKRNAEQAEYMTSFSPSITSAYAIPVTVDNMADTAGFESGVEMCAYFLEAFAYESVNTLTTAFYDQVLRKQMVRDAESVEMLDLALRNKVYDPVYMFNFGAMGSIFKDCGSNGSGGSGGVVGAVGTDVNYETLVSVWQSRLDAARKSIKNYLSYLDQIDETDPT